MKKSEDKLRKLIREVIANERKNVGKGPKKTIMCCCALSAPNLTACVGPFDGCSDCCLAGVSDGCGGQESPLYTITKHR